MASPALTVAPRTRRIFLVDDDIRTAKRLASMLEEDGFVVEVMRDGSEAVARMDRDPPPDAIVTDLVMLGMSGIAVLGAARRRGQSIPVIFVTGHPQLLARPPIPFEPSPIVFTKPVAYADLRDRLNELLPEKA